MTEHFKAPEIIRLSSKQIANLLDAQFKTLVIRTLTELVEFVRKVVEKMKPMLRKTKENVQGTNSDANETEAAREKETVTYKGLRSTVWTRRKIEAPDQKKNE